MPDTKDQAQPPGKGNAGQPAQGGQAAEQAKDDESVPGLGENQAGFVKDRGLSGGSDRREG
jgi:hypothetical protein